jgi:hypothetical protein
MRRFHPALALALLLLPACGGGGGGTPPAPPVLAVVPAQASIQTGQTQAFSATLNGAATTAVAWTVVEAGGGGIDATGLYTPPAAAGTYHVQAALSASLAVTAQASVTVTLPAAGVPGLGIGAPLNGWLPFPADNPWNQVVSALPADPDSSDVISYVGAATTLHPDFGSGLYDGSPIGIPYAVVAGNQARVAVAYNAYGDESDPGPFPVPSPPPYEGVAPTDSSGDRHVLVLDRDNGWLYELYGAQLQADGTWTAGSGAVWDVTRDDQRPLGWTSADAAGLAMFPGLAKYDEVAAGAIRHALRLTVPVTQEAWILPATHWASSVTDPSAPPMGARFRLKASYDISGFPPQSQVVLKALQTYGMIVADNGSAWYLGGAPDPRWDNDDLHTLGQVTGADLELVTTGSIVTSVPSGAAPAIQSFTATPAAIASGGSSTLAWSATQATRYFVNPGPGPVRGASAAVSPAATTIYTLVAEGPYGSATATVTVTVQPGASQ